MRFARCAGGFTGTSMNPPSLKALNTWIRQQPDGDYTCACCGKVGPHYYVQPQHPFWADGKTGLDGKAPARCTDCFNEAHRQARTDRKAELAALPRCEVPGCSRRGAWRSRGVLPCGTHLKNAKNGHARAAMNGGILGALTLDFDRTDILRWAQIP